MRTMILLVFVVFASCTSARPLTDQTFTKENLSEQLNVEDRIKVLKKDGEKYGGSLKIDAIEEDYLLCHNNIYENLIIPYSSIEKIEDYHFSMGNTIALVLPVALILSLIIWIDAMGGVSL